MLNNREDNSAMDQPKRLKDLLGRLKGHFGSNERLARSLTVSTKALAGWLKKSEDDLQRLHPASIDKIRSVAVEELGLDIALLESPPALWDVEKSYEENISASLEIRHLPTPLLRNHRVPFLGYTLNSPFGCSASVLTATSPRIRFLARTGCDLITYKTVRSSSYRSHLTPNLFICPSAIDIDPDGPRPASVVVEDVHNRARAVNGLMNRFGMPSPPLDQWKVDFSHAKELLGPGQMLILSVVGTARRDAAEKILVRDFVTAVEHGLEAGAEVFELNTSCPNCNGLEGFLGGNSTLVIRICKAVRECARQSKILLKIGSASAKQLHELVMGTAAFVDGYSAINTVPVVGLRQGQDDFEPAYGRPGLEAGLSGKPIFRLGLRAIRDLARIREVEGLGGKVVIGIGGVSSGEDVRTYLEAGANAVQATTAFFDDALFGLTVRRTLDAELPVIAHTILDYKERARVNWSRAIDEMSEAMDDSRVSSVALAEWNEWQRRFSETASLGPLRVSVPTVEDFKGRILRRLHR
jgi:dihydroorotate dehydrogenase (NAD+) catalytic subunit